MHQELVEVLYVTKADFDSALPQRPLFALIETLDDSIRMLEMINV